MVEPLHLLEKKKNQYLHRINVETKNMYNPFPLDVSDAMCLLIGRSIRTSLICSRPTLWLCISAVCRVLELAVLALRVCFTPAIPAMCTDRATGVRASSHRGRFRSISCPRMMFYLLSILLFPDMARKNAQGYGGARELYPAGHSFQVLVVGQPKNPWGRESESAARPRG